MKRPHHQPRLSRLLRYIAQALNGERADHLGSQRVTHNLAETRRILDYENAPRREMVRAHEREL